MVLLWMPNLSPLDHFSAAQSGLTRLYYLGRSFLAILLLIFKEIIIVVKVNFTEFTLVNLVLMLIWCSLIDLQNLCTEPEEAFGFFFTESE